jgi:uncharacterized protein (DUF433 family)
MDSLLDRIIVDSRIVAGNPVVERTRMPFDLVLEHLAYDPDLNALFAAFPHLTIEDAKACIEYSGQTIIVDHMPTRRNARPK